MAEGEGVGVGGDRHANIIGVGGSAGGLAALTELIENLELDGVALVIVQHLSPDHESHLAELLDRAGKIDVVTAADGMRVEPNHAYVIPPNTDLAMVGGILRLVPFRREQRSRLPIDFFFRSLALDLGPAAVGVILSGTGTDGTFGLKEIKAAGGITFVQDPATARFDGMPQSALGSGHADFCLGPAEIARELVRIHARPPRSSPTTAVPGDDAEAVRDGTARLLLLIRNEFGHDLVSYKSSTVQRRIERRMTFLRIERIAEYIERAAQDPDELRALYDDMLINVTSFFRDHDPFVVLKAEILPQVFRHKTAAADPVRVWVPACASGEEAYSIAICVLEGLEEAGLDNSLQVFGTDIDEDAIAFARRGIYPSNIALDVSPERLARFFVSRDDSYQISRRVRDLVVFSTQNVLQDAPFSRIDLASCRNLLIYLQPAAQHKVLRVIHYALQPFGFALLGTSETVGDAPDLFSLVDRRNKFYSRKNQPQTAPIDFGRIAQLPPARTPVLQSPPLASLERLADRRVLDRYGPPGVVVNAQLDIVQFRGQTGRFLGPIPGTASLNVLRMARPDLHAVLVGGIREAQLGQVPVTARVAAPDHSSPSVDVDILPIEDPYTGERCLLILFHDVVTDPSTPAEATTADDDPHRPFARRVQELERELAVTRDYLQRLTEERESANEELRAANEELHCANEELQSTNEELETSKEEMQSANEELSTVNDELQHRMEQLNQAHDDLVNVLSGVDHAVLIIDMDRRIRRYTSAAERLFNLVPGDIGRAIDHVDRFLGTAEAASKVKTVVDTLATVEEEILCSNHRWYLLRISPYRTADHVIRGAVLSLSDIDVQKRALELSRNVGDYAARFLGAIGHPLVIVDNRLRIIWANDPFFRSFQLSSEETIGSVFRPADGRDDASSTLRRQLEAALASGEPVQDTVVGRMPAVAGRPPMRLGASRLPLVDTRLLLVSLEDTQPAAHEAS